MKLEDLARKFMEKNPTLLRDIMESEYISVTCEFRQGKLQTGKVEQKHYKKVNE